jgi:hypothetical protein
MVGAAGGGGVAAERAVRWERSRLRHQDALRAAGFLPWGVRRRDRTRLRYACFTPAGPLVRSALLLLAAGYAGWVALGHGTGANVLRVTGFLLLVLVLSTNRASVTDDGLSYDVTGLRQVASFGFVPLWAVQDVAAGSRPDGWPRGPGHGGPWPGRRRVHVRYTDQYGADRVRSGWVRRPQQYVDAVRGGQVERKRKHPRRR